MGPTTLYGVNAAITGVICVAAIGWWLASRRRLAAETVGRAEEQARQLRQQAERDAENLRKEAQLEAREKAHTLLAGAEEQARDRRQEILTLEQSLADKTRALADRLATSGKGEQGLRARERFPAQQGQTTAATRPRSQQAVTHRARQPHHDA